ncbi:tRNA 2-selenouridine(34) synthase MnmH [Bdellovibrio sp. 22V]|uniref:tRNA 2-selenouridine(34) synthase MnmH n=1 Tax=Bdellovibrio TaxID=958 RepID=UPI002543B069|nr:tRNA 2-selenouridine(34) synthase MnmH [Bdellovibrio sp. 22V]WII73671.1 tRNA 2-selenouridine(34) synthase MnmH [Bdellovibrio sp. 22V]
MNSTNIKVENLKDLFLHDTPLLDVRAPIEFSQGHLPGAVNRPILNDAERALIGTTYKQQGQAAAVKLGYELISGPVKEERVQAWKAFFEQNPSAVIYCFRGGKRSQITQQWLKEAGVERPLIVGGYKVTRQFLMSTIDEFSQKKEFLVVSGPTGSGKTELLKTVESFYPTVNLEALAHHRGSAFGSLEIAQPTQINFENKLAVNLLKIEDKTATSTRPLVEDESRMIGQVYQPTSFFERLRSSQVLWLDEPLEKRVDNIFHDYILSTDIGMAHAQTMRCAEEAEILRAQVNKVFLKYKTAVQVISRKLGGLRAREILTDIEAAELDFWRNNTVNLNKVWIEKLLSYYYDPLYLGSLQRREVRVAFKGPASEAFEFLKSSQAPT